MVKVLSINVYSLEPAAKYPGKWLCNMSVNSSPMPQIFWVSDKQAKGIMKNYREGQMLYAAFDYSNPQKPRFIWCGNNQEWLMKSFVKDQPEEPKSSSSDKITFKEMPSHLIQPTLTDDDIPF